MTRPAIHLPSPHWHRVGQGPCTTGAGEDNGIDHNKNWLRFPCVFILSRSDYLHPHPYEDTAPSSDSLTIQLPYQRSKGVVPTPQLLHV
jgi:hypothetical protein